MLYAHKCTRAGRVLLFIFACAILIPTLAHAQLKQPLLSEDNLKKVSDHVYVIEGFPNVAHFSDVK